MRAFLLLLLTATLTAAELKVGDDVPATRPATQIQGQAVKDFANWPTIPQLYVNGEFVGGSDIVSEMYQSGELQKMLPQQAAA